MNANKLYAVRLAHSADGGQSIASRVDAHDPAAAKFFQHPQLAREPGGGLDLSYYAGDFDKDMAGTFRRSRADGPASPFMPSTVVQTPVDFLTARGDPQWLGDYTGIFAQGGELYLSYAVNDSGISHIAFAKAQVP